jgi:hypothetical protein
MTTPHDDEPRPELLDAPDHRPDFWTVLDADLAAEERENVVPLAPAGTTRVRGRGWLLAAAVLVMLGGIAGWFALSGEDDGPEPVTVAPDDVPEAVRFQFRWIDPDGDPDPDWSMMAIGAFGDYRVDYPDGSAEGWQPMFAWRTEDASRTDRLDGLDVNPRYAYPDELAQVFQFGRRIGLNLLVDGDVVEEADHEGRDALRGVIDDAVVVADEATWLPMAVEFQDGRTFEVTAVTTNPEPEAIASPVVPSIPANPCCRTVAEATRSGWPAHNATWLPAGFTLARLRPDEPEAGHGITQTYRKPWRLVEVMISPEFSTVTPAGELASGTSTSVEYPSTGSLHIRVSGDVSVGERTRILEGLELADPDASVVELVPADAVQSVTATVERVSEVGASGEFTLVADQDGTVILKSVDADFGYHAPSGATWGRESEQSVVAGRSETVAGVWNETDPINGRSRLESLLYLDLAEAVRYGQLGTVVDRDGRSVTEATVDLADNESAGWFDRTATVVIDDETGLVLDATITDAAGEVVEELHLTEVEWSEERADVSGAVGVDSDWVLTEGLPDEPVVGDRYLVPEGIEPVRTFTTTAAVQSGSEAGNPEADGAYVIDVTTAPWRHSKIVVLGRTAGEWQDPLAEEGWFTEPEMVTPTDGALSGVEGQLVASPPQQPRTWFDLTPTEMVAIEGLVDLATAEQLWDLVPANADPEPFVPTGLPAITAAPSGAESAFSIEGTDGGGMVVARRIAGGAAAESAWARAVDEIWWEPDRAGIRPWYPERMLDTAGTHAVVLLDAFLDDGGEIAVIYGEVPPPGGLDGAETNVWLQRFGQARSEAIALGWFAGPEYGVDVASRGADRIAVSAGADLGEVFTFYDLEGNEIDEPNNPVPVGHRYNEPPFYQHVALAPDGRTLAFIEGPDWDRTTETTIGDWELVVVDLDSGEETARILLFDRGTIEVTHLDFDGTWAIVSRDDPIVDRAEPVTALAVDTATGTVSSLPGIAGIVTLVDAG